MGDTILRVDDIQKFYGNKGNLTKAIDHISFSVRKGEFLGIMSASPYRKGNLWRLSVNPALAKPPC